MTRDAKVLIVFLLKDIFGGDESKIMDMLDAIIDWADKNGFNTATV